MNNHLDKLKGVRKFIGYFVSIGVLLLCAKWHSADKFSAIAPFVERITYAFMGANVIEHLVKGIVERLHK